MIPQDRLTETLLLSVMFETNKQKSAKVVAYLSIAEKAYKKFLEWNGKLMRYDLAERQREGWTMSYSKIETAHIAEGAWSVYTRCMERYLTLVKSL